MRHRPLRDLTDLHFRAYNSAASSGEPAVAEVCYFLPRLLELMALGADLHFAFEATLRRLGACPADAFSAAQRHAIDTFARAHFGDFLSRHPWVDTQAPDCWGSGDNAFAVLLMWDIGGVDIRPLLDDWAQDGRPSACCHYVESGNADFWACRTLDNPFAEDRPVFRQRVSEWMLDRANQSRFATALAGLQASQAVHRDCDAGAHPTPQAAIAHVLDRLAPDKGM